ncbi:MAG: hypothetical protein EPO07_12995 [Verrucomicrobia bacterium]|nr:MAG: hypothetical protein EPO07_12995 [Verrucomicrobiota bacterium]
MNIQHSTFNAQLPSNAGAQAVRRWKLNVECCKFAFLLLSLSWFGVAHAQSPVLGNVKNFNLSEYFEAPHQTQMKWELTSANAKSVTNGTYLLKDMRIELFRENGQSELVVSAPECVYDPATRTASSAGRCELRSGDGQFVTTGEGFLWNQADTTLRISNRVQTVVQMLPKKKSVKP